MGVVDHWNCATRLPSPGICLVVETIHGEIVDALRLHHLAQLSSDLDDDLGYRTISGKPISVKRWRYK